MTQPLAEAIESLSAYVHSHKPQQYDEQTITL